MSEQDNLQNADGTTNEDIIQQPELNSDLAIESQEIVNDTIEMITEENDSNNSQEDKEIDTEIPEKDYSKLSIEELTDEFNGLIKKYPIQKLSPVVKVLKDEFSQKFNMLIQEKREAFISEGGEEKDFYYNSDTKKRFNNLSKTYRNHIQDFYKQRDEQQKENLNKRLEIIDSIKALVDNETPNNSSFKEFKKLQEQWRNAGHIPRDKYNNAWNSYHHHVERFYDLMHLNWDLRDMDFKHNLEQKQKLISQAQALATETNINRAERELQQLHKIWKEDLGPVERQYREDIWEQFKAATKVVHNNRQAYYEALDKSYEGNLERKNEIISQIENIAQQQVDSHNQWQNNIKKIETLKEAFFNAGKVPLKQNEPTWQKFKAAVRTFNSNKNKFYKSLKSDQQDNLKKKLELIKIAEDNKDSEDFDTITPLMKKIQSDWKKIGHVPRKDSDKIWKQFRAACNHYFDKINHQRDSENQVLVEAYDKKVVLLDNLKKFKPSGDQKEDISTLKSTIKEWSSIGHVPKNKMDINDKFFKKIDGFFDQLRIDKQEAELIKYENKLESMRSANNSRLVEQEYNFIRKKMDEVTTEITQLENNLQFFSNVDDNNPIVKDVHKNIAKQKESLDIWKLKLKKVRALI